MASYGGRGGFNSGRGGYRGTGRGGYRGGRGGFKPVYDNNQRDNNTETCSNDVVLGYSEVREDILCLSHGAKPVIALSAS